MSTNSLIGIKKSPTEFRAIYCHWDGYPEYVGTILYSKYKTKNKVLDLLALGAISNLGEYVKPIKKYENTHSFENPAPFTTVAYYRDREKPAGLEKESSLNYIIKDGHYTVANPKDTSYFTIEYVYLFDPKTCKWESYHVEGENTLRRITPNYRHLVKEALKNSFISE